MPAPPALLTVRVIDATLTRAGGPARLHLRGLTNVRTVAAALPGAVGPFDEDGAGFQVTADPDDLCAAIRDAGAAPTACDPTAGVHRAIAAWLDGPADMELGGGRGTLPTGRRTLIQAVLNVTPDSFSDGGTFLPPDGDLGPAIDAGRRMVAAGADVIDVGGESTRPGATPVPEDLELERTVPVVRALVRDGALVSIDTTKAAVARAAVDAGAAIVNDVSAGALDPALIPTVAELDVAYVLMHMRGTPRTMQNHPTYVDVVGEVFDHLAAGLQRLEVAGIPASRVAVDPGIGFGKTVRHNLTLLRRLRELTSLGRPVLIGASRKSFIGQVSGSTDVGERLEGSLAAAVLAVAGGARIVRVHDVAATVRAVAVADAVADTVPPEETDDVRR